MDDKAREAQWEDKQLLDENVTEVERAPAEHEPAETRANKAVQESSEQGYGAGENEKLVPLFQPDEAEQLRLRWVDIQGRFVDNPRLAVENADQLVNDVITSITENFARERTPLENRWKGGEQVSTEDLRLTMQRYRSFFERLLRVEF